MQKYIVASLEGEERYSLPQGATVELDLTPEQETALIAAGWLEKAEKPASKKAKGE